MLKMLLGGAITFIVIAVAIMVGVVIVEKTYVVGNATYSSANLNTAHTDTIGAITTFTGFLPIIAIALIGGLAIALIVAFMAGGGKKAGGY